MRKDDLVRFRHMIDAAREAISFVEGKSRPDLDADRKLVLSLVKDIEIAGEAAANVSAEMRATHPEIPWADAIATRNRLIHGYFDIDLDIVWDTATKDLPPLVAALDKLIAPLP